MTCMHTEVQEGLVLSTTLLLDLARVSTSINALFKASLFNHSKGAETQPDNSFEEIERHQGSSQDNRLVLPLNLRSSLVITLTLPR